MIKEILKILSNDWNQATKAMESIERVRKIHSPIPDPYQLNLQLCSHCGNEVDGSWIYPCPTIKALDGKQ